MKAQQIIDRMNQKYHTINIKFTRYYATRISRDIVVNSINKMMRIIDTMESNKEYAKTKYSNKIDLS